MDANERLNYKIDVLDTRLKFETFVLRFEAKLRVCEQQLFEQRYAAGQLRVPAGNSDGGQWTDGGGGLGSLLSITPRPRDVLVAGLTTKFEYACKVLRLDPIKASKVLHAIKRENRIRGDANCDIDTETGDVFYNGEYRGNLFDR